MFKRRGKTVIFSEYTKNEIEFFQEFNVCPVCQCMSNMYVNVCLIII